MNKTALYAILAAVIAGAVFAAPNLLIQQPQTKPSVVQQTTQTTSTQQQSTSTQPQIDAQEEADKQILRSYIKEGNFIVPLEAYASSTPEQRTALQNAVLDLYKKGRMQVSKDIPSSIIRVGYDPNDETPSEGNVFCGLYGDPFCAYLIEEQNGGIRFFSLVDDGEHAERIIPEGILLKARNGDAGFGFEKYSLIDFNSNRTPIMENTIENDQRDCGQNNTINAHGLTLKIVNKTADLQTCDKFLPVEFSTGEDKAVKSPLPIGTTVTALTLDPEATLRSAHSMSFQIESASTTYRLVYDGSVTPPSLQLLK